MIKPLTLALKDMFLPAFRHILFKAIGLTLLLFILVMLGVQWLVSIMIDFSWSWAENLAAFGAGLVLLLAFFFMMAPVVAIFAGFYLDQIAELVEKIHYPQDPLGKTLPWRIALVTSLQFAGLVLLVNLALLPLLFTGLAAFALTLANAYILSREYFEMVAMRHMPVAEAKAMRRGHTLRIFVAGMAPAIMALFPLINLLVPLFSTAYFVHIFKELEQVSAETGINLQ